MSPERRDRGLVTGDGEEQGGRDRSGALGTARTRGGRRAFGHEGGSSASPPASGAGAAHRCSGLFSIT